MPSTAQREMEWQFCAEDLQATRAWIAQQPAEFSDRRFAPRAPVELRDTYFDSADWMVFRAGYALRLRNMREESGHESSELTLKSLAPARAGFANRLEFSEAVPSSDIQVAMAEIHGLGEKLRSLLGTRPLVPLFRAHTHRERQLLLEADTELPLAELDLDQTSIESPDGHSRQLVRVEVECMNAESAVLAPFVEQLRVAAGLTPADRSKFQTGLDVAGLASSLPLALPRRAVTATQSFAQSQLAVLARYFQVMIDQEPAARAGSTLAVHEMRVAARHLDTLLKAFGPYGPQWAVRSRKAIHTLVGALGAVRDCDVQIDYLAAAAGKHAANEPGALAPMSDHLETERRKARASLTALLDAASTREWMEAWQLELTKPQPAEPAPDAKPTASVARELIRAQARRLRKRGDRIDEESTPDDYHEVRIRAKRLRYTLDAFATLYGEPAADYMKALEKLQDILGNYHDATVRVQRFRKFATRANTPGAASFALGRLVESDSAALLACRDKFPRAWERTRRRRWRALEAAMKACDTGQR